VPQANLPLITLKGYIKTEPVEVLDTRALPRNDNVITQCKMKWKILTDQAMWEDKGGGGVEGGVVMTQVKYMEQ
jgi:hypothetical protein